MSNTLNTPVEALETEFPLRVRELSLRRGSGGAGRHRGGDGIVREIEALAPMRFTLITERRRHAPRGRDGGGDGAPGRNLLTASRCPARRPESCARATGCGSRRPAAAGTEPHLETGVPGSVSRVANRNIAHNLAIRPARLECAP